MEGDARNNSTPRVFISYSWGSEQQKAWVLQLATRLVKNGVDVVLDQWDARLGSDLSLFMEEAVGESMRVIAVVTPAYVAKANNAKGGVGYEKRLLTAEIVRNLKSTKVIPLFRDNPGRELPRFLGSANSLDFNAETDYEAKYGELVFELYGRQIRPRPALGQSPFADKTEEEVLLALRHDQSRYASPSLAGSVTFDHSNNSGSYTLGSGDMAFTLNTSNCGPGAVYVYDDAADIKTVALAKGVSEPCSISDATQYDGSSRVRTIKSGDSAILRNTNGYWCVVSVDKVHTRESSPNGEPALAFRYVIQPNRTANFTNLRVVQTEEQ